MPRKTVKPWQRVQRDYRVTPDVLAKIDYYAVRYGMSRGRFVRETLERALNVPYETMRAWLNKPRTEPLPTATIKWYADMTAHIHLRHMARTKYGTRPNFIVNAIFNNLPNPEG
jgi:hypothetical protein